MRVAIFLSPEYIDYGQLGKVKNVSINNKQTSMDCIKASWMEKTLEN